jgi:HEAT repeat protein
MEREIACFNRRSVKRELLTILAQPDLDEIYRFLQLFPTHLLLNGLFSALSNSQERIRWNAVYGFGQIVSTMAQNNMEAARVVMRRLLWSLNDESGGIGWGSAEAMAEIMLHSATLRHEYLHMLISYMHEDGEEDFQDGNFLELPLLQRGVLWGVGRLCHGHLAEMKERLVVDDILRYLSSPDEQVVGLAVWCISLLGGEKVSSRLANFIDHPGNVWIFLDGQMRRVSLADLAKSGLTPCLSAE